MNTILRLFYDLSVYRTIVTESGWKIIGRFLLAYLILSLGYGLYFHQSETPGVIDSFTKLADAIQTTLPDQAEFSLKDNVLSTQNLDLPYLVADSIYLDPPADVSSLATSAATVTINRDVIRLQNDQNTHEIIAIKDLYLDDFNFSGQDIKSQLQRATTFIGQIRPYIPLLLAAVIFPILSLLRLAHVVFYALLFLLGIYLSKSGYRYGQVWKFVAHAIIVAETLNLAILAVYGAHHPTIFSIAFIGMSILAYMNLPAKPKLPKA